MARSTIIKCDGCGKDLSSICQDYFKVKSTYHLHNAIGLSWDYCPECWEEIQKSLLIIRKSVEAQGK